jgi:hypothetical protein
MNEHYPGRFGVVMAGIPGKGGVKGRSGPPGNMNAFKHGLAAIQKRREEGIPTAYEENVRQQILDGLIADKGGNDKMNTAMELKTFGQWEVLEGFQGVEYCPTP